MKSRMTKLALCSLGAACLLTAALLGVPRAVAAEESDPAEQSASPPGELRLNVTSPTGGGKQFWTDELVFHDWRIQRNVLTSHYRLLDESNVRQAWGGFAACRDHLRELKFQRTLPPMRPRTVILLHGLGRTRDSMEGMCQYLRDHADWTAMNLSYASTRESLDQHAASLGQVIRNLEGVQEISFVAHSLGNLVIRRYLALRSQENAPPQPRLGRIVMLAPPNQGAQLAERFRRIGLFEAVMGASGTALANHWDTLERQLAVPDCEFGIIAGGTGRDEGRNPILDGDDDLVVSVAETRLAGARDFAVIPSLHTIIMDHPLVREYTLRFLQQGFFVAQDQRSPLPHERDATESP